MTPKEKAEELIREFKKYAYYPKTKDDELFVKELKENAKQCALIAVDFAMNSKYSFQPMHGGWVGGKSYYEELKQEIEKL